MLVCVCVLWGVVWCRLLGRAEASEFLQATPVGSPLVGQGVPAGGTLGC